MRDRIAYGIINMGLMGYACFAAGMGLKESYPFLTIAVFVGAIEAAIEKVSK